MNGSWRNSLSQLCSLGKSWRMSFYENTVAPRVLRLMKIVGTCGSSVYTVKHTMCLNQAVQTEQKGSRASAIWFGTDVCHSWKLIVKINKLLHGVVHGALVLGEDLKISTSFGMNECTFKASTLDSWTELDNFCPLDTSLISLFPLSHTLRCDSYSSEVALEVFRGSFRPCASIRCETCSRQRFTRSFDTSHPSSREIPVPGMQRPWKGSNKDDTDVFLCWDKLKPPARRKTSNEDNIFFAQQWCQIY